MKRALFLVGALIACGAPAAPAPFPPTLEAPAPSPIAPSAVAIASDAGAPPRQKEPARSDYEDLLAALGHDDADGARDRVAKHETFAKLRLLADPRSADGLAAFAAKAAPRWRTEAAFALAELGDLRAAEHLAWRLEQVAKKLYPDPLDIALTQDDHERILAARLLGHLVVLHPSDKDLLRSKSERAVLAWLSSVPAPHANGMRVLALVGSAKGIARLRTWAEPTTPIPAAGTAMFSPDFATAQSALRWLGAAQVGAAKRDEAAWALLVKQLGRRPASVDASMNAALSGGSAVKAMALRALAIGAMHGFAEWGDPKAFDLVVAHVEEAKNNEGSRTEACAALAWVGDDRTLARLVDKIANPNAPELVKACYLQSLSEHPVAGVDTKLAPIAHAATTEGAGAALGYAGFGPAIAGDLVTWLDEPAAQKNAAVALFFGGTRDQAATAFAKVEATATLDDVKVEYVRAAGRVTDRAYESGAVARWVRNASASPWATKILERSLGESVNGPPHTMTRELLRFRALADAKSPDEPKRTGAIAILQAMGERGALASLGEPLAP